jgi:hypothetical protein
MPGDLAPTVVIIPPGGSFHDYLNGESGDSVTFTFTGTLSYVIDYELPGDGLDAF